MTEAAEDRAHGYADLGVRGTPTNPSVRRHGSEIIDVETRNRLFRLAYRFLWNRDDAEDAVHSAVATACERSHELRDSDKWWSWLCSIVVQHCRVLRRRQRRWRVHLVSYAQAPAEPPRPTPSGELSELIRELLPRLPRRQYEVVVLRDLQGMSYDEIAAVLSISAPTARVHARAGRESLRELISERRAEELPQRGADDDEL